jgi:G:T/U-mismatch repair DNA glycosylase
MIEKNPFRCFIPPHAVRLILGSFPCHNGKDYGHWYYSGSGKNHFWQLLSDTFGMPATTKKEKIALCVKNKIALSDIAYKVIRSKGNCSDANLSILEFNKAGIDACLAAGISEIFFTSKFVERQFLKNYPDLKLKTGLLLSPSPAANMHIGGLKEYKDLVKKKKIKSPYEYRLMKYKDVLIGSTAL